MKSGLFFAILLAALPLAAKAQEGTGIALPATPCERGDSDAKTWMAACRADIAAASPSDKKRLASDYANLTFADINFALQTSGPFDTAVADATKGIAYEPDNGAAYLNRANAYFYAGDYDKSLSDIVDVIRIDPKEGKPHNLRCEIYLKQNKAKEAIGECEISIVLGFDSPWAHLSLADALLATGDKEGAIAQYRWALGTGGLYRDDAERARAALKTLGASGT